MSLYKYHAFKLMYNVRTPFNVFYYGIYGYTFCILRKLNRRIVFFLAFTAKRKRRAIDSDFGNGENV